MRILFSVLRPMFLRHFESAVRELAARGHEVHLAVHIQPQASGGADALPEALSSESERITWSMAPSPGGEGWHELGLELRAAAEYVQFLDPRYEVVYRDRMATRVPARVRRLANRHPFRSRPARATLAASLRAAERARPLNRDIVSFMGEQRPDVVLLTPYVDLKSVQPDFLLAARALGIRSAVCVASWDNLSSKSLLRPLPDAVTVWNETQRREAVDLHGVPEDRVRVTGAQCYDLWFDWEPRPRGEFCERVGLDPDRPFVLYTCFTPFKGGPSEVDFVRGWIERLRSSGDPDLARAGVLVRPHPKRATQWAGVDFPELGDVAVWPRESQMPVDRSSKADYYDSIYHSTGVVGLNTSALIEAGIVGRRVHTILAPEFWESQQGTLHFRYLMEVGGGLLRSARDMDEHLEQLADSVRNGGGDHEAARFVGSFVRPHGLDRPATPIFADTVEAVGRMGPARPAGTPAALRALRPLLRPLADRAAAQRVWRDERKRRKQQAPPPLKSSR